ncbi:MAG: ATP synthase F0 subunit B [Deltaproteobacteria bacterium]|jgi:F-type H+-transporting ATPase subunit b|nr:ATP synthase F0 subunit B [Deltaproteobacteria bacterium]MBN2846732.1 ATP synthase F0 subunit B [Deltaproteobacteria bacterium]
MIDLNYTMLIQMINFLVLIFILNLLLYKPITKIIDERNKKIEDSKREVESLDEKAELKIADYEEKMRQARQEAMNQRNEVKDEGEEAGKKIVEGARGEISTMIEGFKVTLASETEAARNVLRDQAKKIAVEISEKVLGRGVQ